MGSFLMNFQGPLLSYIILLYIVVNKARALSPDGQALVSFRTTILSSDGVLLQWRPEDPDPCGWKGVKCDPKSKRVTSLSLPNHKLSGSISSDVGKLEHLRFLALHDNSFYGTVPSALGNCTELKSLSLPNHKLSGSISSDVGKLEHLRFLALHDNSFYGTVPSALGNCTELKSL
ncbi:unnamed protein product [Ilex paraguariensis]|uniref:Leucine-rich repeat-containing N-terminal plant-type domain-containing protein n=1 Tax=Ilex paraguariensis TaxID=185542 RepID=A0ABC8R724_9AQUA